MSDLEGGFRRNNGWFGDMSDVWVLVSGCEKWMCGSEVWGAGVVVGTCLLL